MHTVMKACAETEKSEPKTCAVVRTWENNPEIAKAVGRALKNGVHLVIVVVKSDDVSTQGNVRRWLDGHIKANPGRVIVFEMVQGYTWSNALNLAFDDIRATNDRLLAEQKTPYQRVLTVSSTVLWESHHLKKMHEEMSTSSRIGVVGTSFVGRQAGNASVDLGRSYEHPRNTFMLINWKSFERVGHFSPMCDIFGGMEDLHFLFRMEAAGDFEWRRLDLKIPLLVGVHHHQPTKERREIEAMIKILDYERAIVARLEEAVRRLNLTDLVK